MLKTALGIIAGLFGLTTGATGLTASPTLPPQNQAVTKLNTAAKAVEPQQPGYEIKPCYNPELDKQITLKWPDSFQNLKDNRGVLNPNVFTPGTISNPFNSNAQCEAMLLKDMSGIEHNPRTYIRVRQDLRVASCKTDELAGPYTLDSQLCTDGQNEAAKEMRGSCAVTGGFPDLRKVAEAPNPEGGDPLEIFWTPFTHNVGCNFDPEHPNCGQGDKSNMNAKDFLYIKKRADAFDPNTNQECKVRWDERSRHNNPCSHYFDVYLSLDTYEKMQSLFTVGVTPTPLPTTHPEWKFQQNYQLFYQRMANCKEQNLFTPITYPEGLIFPPEYIETPFMASGFTNPAQDGKIVTSDTEFANYCNYVVYNGAVLLPGASLFKLNELSVGDPLLPTFNECPQKVQPVSNVCDPVPTFAPGEVPPDCYGAIGTYTAIDQDNRTINFKVYGTGRSTNFYLKDPSGTYPKIYQYIHTFSKPSQTNLHSPSLQLTDLEFAVAAEYTWATPICKPALYFYPEKPTDLNVKLALDGKLTVSDPVYDPVSGWNVKAYPNGELSVISNQLSAENILATENRQLKTNYPYLYYEADIKGIDIPKEGWVVRKSEVGSRISAIMNTLGFNAKETGDFLEYWMPRLTGKPYYFITLLPQDQINSKEALNMSVTPDTLIRARFIFEGLDVPVFAEPLHISPITRTGFTVTDWGGTLLGTSCDDVIMK